MSRIPPLKFGAAEVDQAYAAWGASCGPAALAAALGLTLDAVRPKLGDFETKGYMNPTMMWAALRRLGVEPLHILMATSWPHHGVARLQIDGPWCLPGVPAAAAYRHTHWVAATEDVSGAVHIFDINAVEVGGWLPVAVWRDAVMAQVCTASSKRASGRWSITHSVVVPRP